MEEHFFKFSILSPFSELVHGISNRSFGDMKFGNLKPTEVIKNRELFLGQQNVDLSDLVVANLAHSSQIGIVNESDKGKGARDLKTAILATDGLITKERGVFLMVTTADCLPVLVYDPILKIAGVIHAGWRGIIGQIIPKTIEKFKSLGSDPAHLIFGIGPGICQKHFVVKKDVLSLFLDYYPSASFIRNNDGYVDLKKAIMVDLKKHGISNHNIEISNACTVCENGLYGSFRKEKSSAPAAAAIIGIKK